MITLCSSVTTLIGFKKPPPNNGGKKQRNTRKSDGKDQLQQVEEPNEVTDVDHTEQKGWCL